LTLLPRIALPGVVRVSLGIENSQEEIDTLIHVLGIIAQQAASTHNGLSRKEVRQQMNDFVRVAGRKVYVQLG
jgi:hypothetical protein